MYERLDNCPLCNSGHFHNKIIAKDHTVSGESFAIVECDRCNLNFTNPRPSEEEIHSFYESDEYISHSEKDTSVYDLAYRFVRHFTIKSKLKLIEGLDTKKSILDFGCGTGNFLEKCASKKWNVTGVEPNAKAREIASQLVGDKVYPSLSEIPENEKFHVITLWHVLEHIHDLHGTLDTLKKKLKKKGYLIIALPNNQSWDANHYKELWAGYDVPRHLYHFNPQTFKTLAKKQKLTIKKIIPQKMDAFYISLLSEKYSYGKNMPIKSIFNGFQSNRFASDNNQYSSLIYVLYQ